MIIHKKYIYIHEWSERMYECKESILNIFLKDNSL